MPTKKQLFDNWIAESKMGLTPSDCYGDEHLSSEEAAARQAKTNRAIQRARENTKGDVLGHYVWDFENNCLKLIPKQD